MLMEIAMTGGIGYVLYHKLFGKKTDREKIELIFKNIKFGFDEHLPSHFETNKKESHTTYLFNLPYGLTDHPKLEYILEKSLNKPVEIEMESKLIIKVYNHNLKSEYKYNFYEYKGYRIPIGYKLGDEMIYHDFEKIPHMTIAGMTRQGKTVLLKLILAHVIKNYTDVDFYILDLKGGLEFGRYDNLKQVKNITSDIEKTNNLLDEVVNKIDEDMKRFREKKINNINHTKINKRTFIIVDEGAELDKPAQNKLSKIARIGGALGYRLIFATQYPTADTLPRQIKQNTDAKVSFRLPTEVASRVAIDEQGAEQLEMPGRAIYKTHEKQIIQVPYISDKQIEEQFGGFESDTTEETTTERGSDTFKIG